MGVQFLDFLSGAMVSQGARNIPRKGYKLGIDL